MLLSTINICAQTWEFVGLDSMVIRQLYVFGDTIYAGTAVRNGFNLNAGLYFSSNNGLSWIQLDSLLGNGSIISLEFLNGDQDTFYLVKGESPYTLAGKLYKTTNGGGSWQIISALENKGINWFKISNFNWNELYALEIIPFPAGSLELLYRSIDAGMTWEDIGSFPSDSHGNNLSVTLDFHNESYLYAAVGTNFFGDYFFKSTDKGTSWVNISVPPIIAADMLTDDYIKDKIYLNMQYASLNGGYNWIEIDSGFTVNSYYLSSYQDSELTYLLFTMRTDGIYISQKDTFFWQQIEESETLPLTYGIGGFTSYDRGLMQNIVVDNNVKKMYVGTGYGIYKRDYTTGVNNFKSEKVNSFNLEQNYPNPFNPNTTINYFIPKNGYVTLKVYDLLGNEILVLVNEEKYPGNYKVEFNGINFSSGVYVYTISLNGITKSKKMILMK